MTSLNSATLPQVSGCRREAEPAGRHEAMEDGTLVWFSTTATGVRRTWACEWWGLTSAQLSTLETALLASVAVGKSFTPPDEATSYTVVADPRWKVEMRKTASGIRYWVSATLRVVTPA